MTEQDKRQFAAIMASLGEVYGREVTKNVMALYFDALGRVTIEALTWAAREVIRKEKFFPVPAVLVEYAGMAPRPQIQAPERARITETAESLAPEIMKETERILREKWGVNITFGGVAGATETKAGAVG